LLPTAALAGLLSLGAGTSANAITVAGITFPGFGATFMTSTIFENAIALPGDVLDGIGRVTSIEDGISNVYWTNGDNSRELTFRFSGYTVEKISIPLAGFAIVWFSGGVVDMYSDLAENFSSASGSGQGPGAGTDIDHATDGTPWLNLVGAGTGTVCAVIDACFSGAGTAITLASSFFFAGSDLAAVTAGTGTGFLDVDLGGTGVANAYFDANNQPSGQDLLLGSTFSAPSGLLGNWPLTGSADIRKIAIPVPEPMTLSLMGLGLAGLGFANRRRRA
jgi:hypothetical protein